MAPASVISDASAVGITVAGTTPNTMTRTRSTESSLVHILFVLFITLFSLSIIGMRFSQKNEKERKVPFCTL